MVVTLFVSTTGRKGGKQGGKIKARKPESNTESLFIEKLINEFCLGQNWRQRKRKKQNRDEKGAETETNRSGREQNKEDVM